MRGGRKYNGIILALLLIVLFCDDLVQGEPLSFIGIGTYQHTEDEGSESQVNQSTTLNFDQTLTPMMTLDENLRYTTTFKDDGSETETITPSLDYQINNDIFYFDLSGSWNKQRNSERSNLTSSNWESKWASSWQKELWPALQLNYGASSTKDDESPNRLDTESTYSGFNIDWDLLLAKVYYNIDFNETDDFAANSNNKSTNQLARLTTEKSFLQDRLNVSFLGQYTKNTQDFKSTGDSALVPISITESRGGQDNLRPDTDLPEWDDLTAFPQVVPAGERYNIAIYQVDPIPVSAIYVYTQDDLSVTESINLNNIQFSVYSSTNGTNWIPQGPTTSQDYDPILQRFEFEFIPVSTRYIMLVRDRIPTDNDFTITRVQAYERVTGDGGDVKSKTDSYNYLGDTSLRFRITPDLHWTYNVILEDGETASGNDIDRTYNSTSFIWTPSILFSSTLTASESVDKIGEQVEDMTRFYSVSFSQQIFPTLDLNYGVTRTDTYEDDEKITTNYNYNMFVTALLFPDLTSNLDLTYGTERDEEEDSTSQDFNSTLKFIARLTPALTMDLTERYNTSSDEESTWNAASLIGVTWRPSDILSIQGGAGNEWDDEDSSELTYYLSLSVAPTYKTQLNLTLNHSEDEDDYSASYNWTINRIFSMHAYCTYVEEEDDNEFAYGGQFVIRY